jgi:hypothetical protein
MRNPKIPARDGKENKDDKQKQELLQKQIRSWISFMGRQFNRDVAVSAVHPDTLVDPRNANPLQRVQSQDRLRGRSSK